MSLKWVKRGTETTVEQVVERNACINKANLSTVYKTPIKNLDILANELIKIKNEGKTVTVFADYDCDGICSAVNMYLILKYLRIQFKTMFPHRKTGYGLQAFNVEDIDTDYIITIDNGIAAFDGIKAAKDKGIKVLIIDHHLKPEEGLPDADIIVDPHVFKNDPDDFEDWCGAGLSYELSRYICNGLVQNICLQFAAIATVADVVPLRKDNRQIVKNGLYELNRTKITALQKFINAIKGSSYSMVIDETTIGFKIAPIINAMGRVEDDAEFVFKYFLTDDEKMLEKMFEVNELRKTMVAAATDRAYNIINSECLTGDIPLVVYDPDTPEGIVGIVAGHLAEENGIPVICLTKSNTEGIIKGSARSPVSVNMKDTLEKVSDLLEHFGGHAGAAGLALKEENLEELRDRFYDIFCDYVPESSDSIQYDLEIKADDIPAVLEELKLFAPFGEGNPNPVFKITDYDLMPRNGSFYRTLGDDLTTLKLFGKNSSAIGFDMIKKYNDTNLCKSLNLIGRISENTFSKPEPQVEIFDLAANEKEAPQSDLAKLLASQLSNIF